MLEYQRLLGEARTTVKDSKKQIDNWFGKEILFKYRLNYVILGIIGLVMIVALIYFIPIMIKSNINDSDIIVNTMKLFLNGMIAIMIIIEVTFIFIMIVNVFAPIKRELIEKKISRDDYLINSNVVDCPLKIKRELFDDLVDREYLYISYDKKENILKFYTDYYSDAINTYNLNKHKNLTDRDSLEYQYWYLAKQLEDNKFYRIADIITDSAIKEKNIHE